MSQLSQCFAMRNSVLFLTKAKRKPDLQFWAANFKFSQLSAGCSESFLPQRHVYKYFVKSQVPNVQGSSLSPPSALEELNLTLRRLSQVSKVALVSLALKIIDLLSFHDMISTLHPAKNHFNHIMFSLNSNDRDVLTQSLLTL